MSAAVFSFNKPTKTGAVPSSMIAERVAQVLKLPCHYTPDNMQASYDVLFLVNGSVGFSPYLPQLAKLVLQSRRVVWIQNDYTNRVPRDNGTAQSPFRKAFVQRRQRGMAPVDYWTTITYNQHTTPTSALINWNTVGAAPVLAPSHTRRPLGLFYYGYFRPARVEYFDRYFAQKVEGVTVTVSSPSHKKFTERYTVDVHAGLVPDTMQAQLNAQSFGVYLQDKSSPRHDYFPAQRFYEMLSAGLPVLFQPESVPTLARVGFDASPYVINTLPDILNFAHRRRRIAAAQQAWYQQHNFRRDLDASIRKAWRTLEASL